MIRRAFAVAAVAGLTMSGVGVAGVLLVSPAAVAAAGTATPRIGSFALTDATNALTTDGEVGATGGLVSLDSGQASIVARLDSTPSSSVLAQPVRPGSFYETVATEVPKNIDVPEANAAYPGMTSASVNLAKSTSIGPLTAGGGSGTAKATRDSITGSVTGAASTLSGVSNSGAATATVSGAADIAAGTLTETSTSNVSNIGVAGVLNLGDISATATLTVKGAVYTEKASVTIGSATVGGVPVSIGSDGVTALGTKLPLGSTITAETKQLNAVLAKVGITIGVVKATTGSAKRSAYANTGGVEIQYKTANITGLGSNDVVLDLGSIVLTETDAAPLPAFTSPPVTSPPPAKTAPTTPTVSSPGTTKSTTTSGGGTPVNSVGPATVGPPPSVATTPSAGASYALAGFSFTNESLIAFFAGWQFLSLMTPTLYALASNKRRRRAGARTAR